MLRLFSKSLVPESASKEGLQVQRNYKLMTTSLKNGKKLLDLIKKIDLKFKIILHLQKEGATTSNRNAADYMYWKSGLKLRKEMIKTQKNYVSHTGPHSRIEIRVINDSHQKRHEFYYLMVALCVHFQV